MMPELHARLHMKQATECIPVFCATERIGLSIAHKLHTLLGLIAEHAPARLLIPAAQKYYDIPDMRGALWIAVQSLEKHIDPTKEAAPYGILRKVQRGLTHCLSVEIAPTSTYEKVLYISPN